jgi:hypothetical protein
MKSEKLVLLNQNQNQNLSVSDNHLLRPPLRGLQPPNKFRSVSFDSSNTIVQDDWIVDKSVIRNLGTDD